MLIPEGSGREFADFCREILEVRDAHVVIIDTSEPGSQHIDASDVTKDVVARINAALTGHAGDPVPLAKVLAFVSSASLEAAASSLPGKPTVLADRVRDVRAFGVRPVLHRRVKTIETEESLAERLQLDVRVSRGMVCEDIDDLLVAYRLLGLPDAAITPTAAGADGSAIVSSTEELRQVTFFHPSSTLDPTSRRDFCQGFRHCLSHTWDDIHG